MRPCGTPRRAAPLLWAALLGCHLPPPAAARLLLDRLQGGLRGAAAAAAGTGHGTRKCRRAGSEADATWNYVDGGASWDVGQCCLGAGQSPINVSMALKEHSDGLTTFFAYRKWEEPVTMLNTGRALVTHLDHAVGTLSIGELYPQDLLHEYSVWKVMIHTPSEHTFEGERVPLELQIFHRRVGSFEDPPAPEDVLVLSAGFARGGRPSHLLDSLRLGGLPREAGAQTVVNGEAPASLDFSELWGPGLAGAAADGLRGNFWSYEGSLTAPPCSAGVHWIVRHDPLPATPEALTDFYEAVVAVTPLQQKEVGNARRLQAACGREAMMREHQDVSSVMNEPSKVEDPSFKAAVVAADGAQKAFEVSMSTPSPRYAECVHRLLTAAKELKAAKARQNVQCGAAAKAKRQLQAAAAGVPKLEAGELYHAEQAECNSVTYVVQALSSELSGGTSRCQGLNETTPSFGNLLR